MPPWNELLRQMNAQPQPERLDWLRGQQQEALARIGTKRGDRNVIFYASSFLQKPLVPAVFSQITHEDINGFMSIMFGMDWSKGLTLLLHTPGGITNAVETIVDYITQQRRHQIETVYPGQIRHQGPARSRHAVGQ